MHCTATGNAAEDSAEVRSLVALICMFDAQKTALASYACASVDLTPVAQRVA